MAMNSIKPGDLVSLKSGGLLMTVGSISHDGKFATCYWVVEADIKQANIHLEALIVQQ